MSYIKNSDVVLRLSVNPFHWLWKPFASFEKPTVLFPTRRTIGIGWLFLQVFVDVDDGTVDIQQYQKEVIDSIEPYNATHFLDGDDDSTT